VAEQLAFEQLAGQARAVDGDERSRVARAPAVDRPGDHAFAGAAFAEHQDVGVAGGDLAGGIEQIGHRRRTAFQLGGIVAAAGLAFQFLKPQVQAPCMQLRGCSDAQLLRRAGLDQVIDGTGAHRLHGGIDR